MARTVYLIFTCNARVPGSEPPTPVEFRLLPHQYKKSEQLLTLFIFRISCLGERPTFSSSFSVQANLCYAILATYSSETWYLTLPFGRIRLLSIVCLYQLEWF
jgi:hypothetical protein